MSMSGSALDEYETLVALMPADDPAPRLRTIDHTFIAAQYLASMVAAPSLIGSLGVENDGDDAKRSILVVGLGGGSLNMYFHTRRPEINITVYELDPTVKHLAYRWFGVRDDETHRTIIGDGINAIQKAIEKGDTYDVLILDACGADEDSIVCPVEAFLGPDMVVKMMNALKPTGVLVVNVLSVANPDGAAQKVKQKLTEVFKACLTFYLPKDFNTVVACVPYGHGMFNNEWRDRKLDYRFDEVKQMLGLYDVLKDVWLL